MSKKFDKWYDEYSYWAEIDETGLPYKICKDAWEASCDEKVKELENKNNELMAKCGHQAISINELKRELEGLE